MSYRAAVITCSNRAAADVYEDRSGPILRQGLQEAGFDVAEAVIVPDDIDQIQAEVRRALTGGARVVMTTGGTGVSPRDVTVEATKGLVAFEIPGLMEEVRRQGAGKEPRALLSRGVAGVIEPDDGGGWAQRAVMVNAPGSRGGARDTISAIGSLLEHVVEQLDGADHDLSRPPSS